MPQTVSAELEQLFDASLQSGEQWEMDRDPPQGRRDKEGGPLHTRYLPGFFSGHP